MKKVDLVRASWLTNPVGPSRTLQRILRDKNYFEERGFNIKVNTLDLVIPRDFAKDQNNERISAKKRILLSVKNISKYSKFITRIVIEKSLFSYGKVIVDYLESQNRNSDIIVFHDIFSCYEYFKSKSSLNCKTVLFYHNNGSAFDALEFYYPQLKKSRYYKELLRREKFILNKIDRVVFIAEYGMKNFQTIHPRFDKEKCTFFHNGIDDIDLQSRQVKHDSVKYRLCCSGTLNKRKGQHLIIEALNKLPEDKKRDIRLQLIGGGPDFELLYRKVSRYNLKDNVIFEGSINNRDIPRKLLENNIFILMSFEEGLPISIIEALRAGLAVISTNISGIPEQVKTGENGVLIDPDVNQLIELLNNMDNYDWSNMGKDSRKKFEKGFTFDKMKDEYCKMLESL